MEVSHGPTLIDNNLLLSSCAGRLSTQGLALVHNLIAGSFTWVGAGTDNNGKRFPTPRYTPYHIPHRTEVAGFMTILHGDARFYNNIFVQQEVRKDLTAYSESIGNLLLTGFSSSAEPSLMTVILPLKNISAGSAMERRRTGETGIFITIIFRSIRAGTYILTVLSPATRRKTIRWIPSIRFSLSLGKMGKAGICRQTCTNICPDLKPNGEHRAFGGGL